MIKKTRKLKFDTVFVLLVFCMFAASVLIVLTLGSSIYGSVTGITREGYDERECLSYIWTKVKTSDSFNGVIEFHGISALRFSENYDGAVYSTVIYHYDGWVRELYFEEGLEFVPEDGLEVIKTDSLVFSYAGDNLVKVTSDGGSLYLHTEGVLPD